MVIKSLFFKAKNNTIHNFATYLITKSVPPRAIAKMAIIVNLGGPQIAHTKCMHVIAEMLLLSLMKNNILTSHRQHLWKKVRYK